MVNHTDNLVVNKTVVVAAVATAAALASAI
jgi:hypothetical protein